MSLSLGKGTGQRYFWLRKLQNSRAAINPSGALLISTFAAWSLQTGFRANLWELYLCTQAVVKLNLPFLAGQVGLFRRTNEYQVID